MPIRFKIRHTFVRTVCHFLRSRRGNIAALTALLIVPLVALMGVATEGGSWFLIQRAAQNAADSAALTAAINGTAKPSSTTYILEAKSVAKNYGFEDGTDNAAVTPVNNQACPSPMTGTNCYKVTITKNVPLFLTQVVGYNGTTALGNGRAQTILASAMAGTVNTHISNCITSLGSDSQAFRVNGNGKGNEDIDLNQCAVQSNGGSKCAGKNADGNAGLYFVHLSNDGCDPAPVPNAPAISDPYTNLYPRTNIPSNPCNNTGNATDYWQKSNNYGEDNKNKTISLNPNPAPAKNSLSGSVALSSTPYCGDVVLTGDTTLTGSGTMVIENGLLDLAGHKLTGAGITIIFTGPTVGSNFNPSHYPPTSGTLDVSAPESGTWSGVAIYQDPALTSGVD